MKTNRAILILLTALAGALVMNSGCARRQVVHVHDAAVAPMVEEAEVVVMQKPPPPQVEVVGTAPNANYVWVPGRWEWRGNWVWTGGRWTLAPQPSARWVPGRWTRHEPGYVWMRGYWR